MVARFFHDAHARRTLLESWAPSDREGALSFGALIFACAVMWWFHVNHLAAFLAQAGFSPTYFVANLRHPEWFARNYPSGAEEFLKSAPMFVYLVADALALPLVLVMKAMIGLEIVLVAASTVWAVRTLWPQSPHAAAWITALFLVCGNLWNADLARWGHPFYGWVYSFAYAGILVGAAAALERRLVLCAVALAFAFASHVTMGVIGISFAAVVLLPDLQRLPMREILLAAVVFAVLAGGWFAFVAGTSHLGSGGIADEDFVAFTRLMSFHWYPVDMGLFGKEYTERFLPFLSMIGLLAAFLPRAGGIIESREARAASGFVALFVLTMAGIYISANVASPLLLKLALHRASGILLVISALYIVPGLWTALAEGGVLRAIVAVLALISAFIEFAGVPLLLTVLLAGDIVREDLGRRGWTARARMLCGWGAIVAAAIGWYAIRGMVDLRNAAYTGHILLSLKWLGVMAVVAGSLFLLRRSPLRVSGLVVVFAALSGFWAHEHRLFPNAGDLTKAEDYLDAQRWANAHTPPGTLFMPDPTHYYGWRGFSLRPSFGNLREWLYSGWIYDSNGEVFADGVERVAAMGIDPRAYTRPGPERPIDAFESLSKALSTRYYAMTAADFAGLGRKFGIAYFVFEKFKGAVPAHLHIVYQNADYAVAAAPAAGRR